MKLGNATFFWLALVPVLFGSGGERTLILEVAKTSYLVAEPVRVHVRLQPAGPGDVYQTPFEFENGGVELYYRHESLQEWRHYFGRMVLWHDAVGVPQEIPLDGLALSGVLLYDNNRGRGAFEGTGERIFALLAAPGDYEVVAVYTDGELAVRSNVVLVRVFAPEGREAEALKLWEDTNVLAFTQDALVGDGVDEAIAQLRRLATEYPDTLYGRLARERLHALREEEPSGGAGADFSTQVPVPAADTPAESPGGGRTDTGRSVVANWTVALSVIACGLVLFGWFRLRRRT